MAASGIVVIRLPESIAERFPALEALEEDWKSVSRWALAAWLGFYALFLLHTATADDQPIADLLWLVIHEGGHLVFSPLGKFLGILGGTLLQLAVPLGFTFYFALKRHLPASALCLFFFFENFLGISVYMADAHKMELPLVSTGSGDTIHDWYYLFSSLHLLHRDTSIASGVNFLGWVGMVATVGWLGWRGWVSSTVPTNSGKQ